MSYIGKVPGKTINGIQSRQLYYASSGQTVFSATYDIGYVDVFVNGTKLISGDDYTANTGTSITLSQETNDGDVVEIIGYGNYQVANLYNRKNLVINGNFDIWQREHHLQEPQVHIHIMPIDGQEPLADLLNLL